jgi:hypothetical protein
VCVVHVAPSNQRIESASQGSGYRAGTQRRHHLGHRVVTRVGDQCGDNSRSVHEEGGWAAPAFEVPFVIGIVFSPTPITSGCQLTNTTTTSSCQGTTTHPATTTTTTWATLALAARSTRRSFRNGSATRGRLQSRLAGDAPRRCPEGSDDVQDWSLTCEDATTVVRHQPGKFIGVATVVATVMTSCATRKGSSQLAIASTSEFGHAPLVTTRRARIAEARHRGALITQASPVALSVLVSVGGVRPRSPEVG